MSLNASRGSKLSINELNSCIFWLFWHNLSVDWSVTVTAPKRRSLFTERFLMYTEAEVSSSVPQLKAGWKVAETVMLLFCFSGFIVRPYFLQQHSFWGVFAFFLTEFAYKICLCQHRRAVHVGVSVWTEGSEEHNYPKSALKQMWNYLCD